MTQNNVGIYASQISGRLWAPNGAMDALATITVPSGGAATVEFTGIPSGYKHLQIRGISRRADADTADGESFMRLGNGFIDTGNNYSTHTIYGNGGGGANALSASSTNYIRVYATPGANQGAFNGFVIDILDYANTSKNKTVRWLVGYDSNGGAADVELTSGAWYSTSVIDAIRFYTYSSFTQHTQFALYGVK